MRSKHISSGFAMTKRFHKNTHLKIHSCLLPGDLTILQVGILHHFVPACVRMCVLAS